MGDRLWPIILELLPPPHALVAAGALVSFLVRPLHVAEPVAALPQVARPPRRLTRVQGERTA